MKFYDGIKQLQYVFLAALATLTFSCDVSSSSDDSIDAPDNYEFSRNGASSVAYPGQTARLDMLAEIDSYVGQGDDGEILSEQQFLNMFSNSDGNGGTYFSYTEKQLRNKTFAPDLDQNLFEDIFARAASASEQGNAGVRASNGVAGLIERENSGSDILVSENGREFGQLIEKGLMGAVFYNQIFNEYLTDQKIGPNVENETTEEGENYTTKEHHFDEAFGYFGAPVDFESDWPDERAGELRFWADYSNGADDDLGLNNIIMDAYIQGRTAIVNKNQDALNEQVDVLYKNLELLTAATAVHYINSTLQHLSNGDRGEALHTLSEAWAFVNAIKYSPQRNLTLEEINQINETDFGENGNFWNVTSDGLNTAKSKLVNAYPELESVQDQL
jgi:hypothetical protein